ncbi:DUF6415 family natural product biosynthesis protein [Kitasatospora sp. NPDC088134]|uniref:DUF6415 family natural product biosynthesis protein n=1 Tax=Kitasatospora sp. NPDC088134 TaxID=3364071 RepID=UPI0038237CAD
MQHHSNEPVRLDAAAVATALDRVDQLMAGAQAGGPPPEDGLVELLDELIGHLALLVVEVDSAYGALPERSAARGPVEAALRGARSLLGSPPSGLFTSVVLFGTYCRVLATLRWLHPLFDEVRLPGVPYGGIRLSSGPPGRHRHARMRAP